MFSGTSITSWLLDFLYSLPGLIIAISFHEWAHAYAAYRLGDPTAKNLGRMTVNPAAHFDPIGFIALVVVHFGWAKPVPIMTRNFKKPRRDELIVSLAGIATNLIIAFVFEGLTFLVSALGVTSDIAFGIMNGIVVINLSLAVFNLLPIPPLDGYHVAECIFRRRGSARFFDFVERYGFILLIGILILNSRVGFLSSVVSLLYAGLMNFYFLIISLFM